MWISVGGGFSMRCRGESGSSSAESGLCLNRIMVSLSQYQSQDLHKVKKKKVQYLFYNEILSFLNMLLLTFTYVTHNAIPI